MGLSRVFQKSQLVAGFGLLVSLMACKSEQFSGFSPDRKSPARVPKTVDVIPTGSAVMSCEPEGTTAVRGNSNALGVPVSFQSVCSDSIQTTDVVSKKRPVDIVFVLDVTKSMQPNIDAVKTNVVEFARRIGGKGWDARFAGVAFRDPPGSTAGVVNDPRFELLYATDFMNDASIAAEISSGKSEWIADDMSDNQEGGQAAIAKALDMLNAKRRSGADAVILFVTDAPSFAGINHWDFTVDALANKMAGVPGLKFYHSSLATFSGNDDAFRKYGSLPTDSRWVGDKSFNIAKNQIEALRRASGKQGSWVDFPLRQSTFVDTLPAQFETVVNTLPAQCTVSDAKVVDVNGNVVLQFSGNAVSGAGILSFQSGILSPGSYTYKETRCCVRDGATFRTCEKTRERQAILTIR
jgi:hypothetical protein